MNQGTVLIIEDDHDTRVALRSCLEQAGYFIVSCTNGASALELLASMTSPSAILLDINMPIMNGDEFLRIAKSKPELRSIPIIQMSAGNNPKREGTFAHLPKPIDLDRLMDAINECRKCA